MIDSILRLEPQEKATSLVILTHGYGADAADLLDLGNYWRPLLPGTAFIAPNAPTPCEMNPAGFQWWSLADGLDPAGNLRRCQQVTGDFARMVESERLRYDVPYNRVALVGFSQGAMLSLEVGLHLPQPAACIISYSGMMLDENPVNITQQAPVLLVHGMQDPIVPFVAYDLATTTLKMAGVPLEGLVRPMMGHGIDNECLGAGGKFLERHLATQTASAA